MLLTLAAIAGFSQANPLRIGIAGLTHDHVNGILARAHDGDFVIVGIAEKNTALGKQYLAKYHLPDSLLCASLAEMVKHCKPEAVCAFNSIAEHVEVVRVCAPKKIHVMVEKPLAYSLANAKEMKKLAADNGILLLTNYETTWYGSHYRAMQLLDTIGSPRKIVVHDGHQGPKEIGVSPEFFAWLTDPVKNGGGAIIDFGCYGANLSTWFMKGEKPLAVTAITQQLKPAVYPKVDDEATIILTYPDAQTIIQASWNWPVGRKDIEIYGETGYVVADRNGWRVRKNGSDTEKTEMIPQLPAPMNDPFRYLAAAVHGQIKVKPTDLSSLDNNMIVVQILDAAKRSAKEGKTIVLPSDK